MSVRQLKYVAGRTGFWAAIIAMLVFALFPLYYAVVTSLKPSGALYEVSYWPSAADWSHYASIFGNAEFLRAIANSTGVAAAVVGIALLFGLTAAYALGRVSFRGRVPVMLIILGVSMFPQVAVLSGLFEVIRVLGLYNNPGALVISYTIFTLPFTVWILTTFMRQLPGELEEAAIMDGATPITTLFKVFMPLLWPAMATTGLLAFIAAWNEFLFALSFTLTPDQRTVPVAIAMLSGNSSYELPWGQLMAASVVVTLPMIGLVLVFQRRIVSGLTAGAVKG